VSLEQGPLSLVSTTEELLERTSRGSVCYGSSTDGSCVQF
jgi:hypothetical protein